MHPADIKAAINKAGTNQAEIAQSLKGRKVSPSAVWSVIHGVSRSADIAQQIARITGMPVAKLWPGKYPQIEGRTARRG